MVATSTASLLQSSFPKIKDSDQSSSKDNLVNYVRSLYGEIDISECPFIEEEINELSETNELLVYLPAKLTMQDLCNKFNIRANVNFENETMIRNTMVSEDQWFIVSNAKTPELINKTGIFAKRVYEDEGLHGMDFRRYLAFAATFRYHFGELPDQTYWCFLLSGSYDRSGVSVVGFDSKGVLSHHGWMKNYKAKYCGSRYIVIPPRVEILRSTKSLKRSRRGDGSAEGKESGMG
ncbi:MAG: hypothetical protein AAF208_04390 [Cyanobacteria bacterium P01_A01_bin.45]